MKGALEIGERETHAGRPAVDAGLVALEVGAALEETAHLPFGEHVAGHDGGPAGGAVEHFLEDFFRGGIAISGTSGLEDTERVADDRFRARALQPRRESADGRL